MAFVERLLNVTFTLGEGSFGADGSNNVTIEGLRILARVNKAGGPSMGTCQMAIFGMTRSQMNKLSTLGMAIQLVRRNTVLLQAGDKDAGMATVFQGTITNAWADFQGQPEVAFQVESHTALLQAVKPVPSSSYPQPTDVAVIMSSLAAQMQLKFENSGVTGKLPISYFYGSARDQAHKVAEAANIEMILDDQIMAIWPKGGSRGGLIPLISKETGMIGYPAYTSKGIMVKTVYNPSVGFGQKIKVQSTLDPANGEWVVYGLDHNLESNAPRGAWDTTIQAARPGLAVVH